MLKRLLSLFAMMLLLLPAIHAEAPAAETEAPATEEIVVEDGAFPVLNEDGFLDIGEFVYENEEDGVWRYVSQDLKIEIYRRTRTDPDPEKKKKELLRTWYEAEVWSRSTETWRIFTNEEGKHMSSSAWPYIVAQKNQVVLAINGDYAQGRWPAKDKNKIGIIIRDGKIFSEKTLKATSKVWPPLDVLALYPDGNMEVYDSNEHTAQEYIDMGVQTTLAFGPYLIRDGVLNEQDIYSMNKGRNPRTAIGMVEPGHTFAMVLEGRHAQSNGGWLDFLAERMLEKGCTIAYNLDGGETSCMVFMGKQITTIGGVSNKDGNARRATELLGIGVSDLVPDYEGK